MDCQKVRDQFSSLREGELKPAEEEAIREHLGSCQGCQKEWDAFNRTMGWLHSVEEEEVPEEFLSEVEKKRKERKMRDRGQRVFSFGSMKIPMQAAAMVAVVFLGLYLTRMGPFDPVQKKAVETPETVELETGRKETAERGMRPFESSSPTEMVKARVSPEEEREGREAAVSTVGAPERRPVQEIPLKIRDREMAVSKIQELTKRLGGSLIREEVDIFLITLPPSSYGEFEKGLKLTLQQEMKDDLKASQTMEREVEERVSLSPRGFGEDMVSLRIRLILE